MNEKNLATAAAYYNAMNNKDISDVAQYLHADIQFKAPLAQITGKETVLEAAKGFMNVYNSLTIRAKFSSGNQVMLAYDLDCPAPIGLFMSAALMTFEDNLITRIELFYDARPFDTQKKQIFATAAND